MAYSVAYSFEGASFVAFEVLGEIFGVEFDNLGSSGSFDSFDSFDSFGMAFEQVHFHLR